MPHCPCSRHHCSPEVFWCENQHVHFRQKLKIQQRPMQLCCFLALSEAYLCHAESYSATAPVHRRTMCWVAGLTKIALRTRLERLKPAHLQLLHHTTAKKPNTMLQRCMLSQCPGEDDHFMPDHDTTCVTSLTHVLR